MQLRHFWTGVTLQFGYKPYVTPWFSHARPGHESVSMAFYRLGGATKRAALCLPRPQAEKRRKQKKGHAVALHPHVLFLSLSTVFAYETRYIFRYIFRSLFLIYNWQCLHDVFPGKIFILSRFFFYLFCKNKWNNLITYITNLRNIKMLIYISYRYYN